MLYVVHISEVTEVSGPPGRAMGPEGIAAAPEEDYFMKFPVSYAPLRKHWFSRSFSVAVIALMLCQVVPVRAAAGREVAPPATAARIAPLNSPPLGERWFSLVMNDERTGFAFVRTIVNPGGYEIFTEGSVKMLVMGFSREAASRERYLVNKDLTLRSFNVAQILDGSAMTVSGDKTPRGVRAVVESKGSRKERLLKSAGPVYPPAVVNLYPLMKGIVPGKDYELQILDVETVKVKKVTVKAVGIERLQDGREAVHLQNDLYPFVTNDVWVDREGNTLRESVRDGMIETRAEPEQAGRRFLVESVLAKKDLILDFSRIPVTEEIERPQELAVMKLEVSDFHPDVPLLEGSGQQARRITPETVLFTVQRQGLASAAAEAPPGPEFLAASDSILTGNPEITSLAKTILQEEREPVAAVRKLVGWVAENIKDSVPDSHSPLETLAVRSGNCQSHARLYASLARTAGIPTRFVSGLVYVPDQGFLYHSWAESYVGRWVAVDPTFGEVPANATHVKLVEGESPQEMAPIICFIGKIRARVVEKIYSGS